MNDSDRAEAIFVAVLALPASERAAYLARVCADEPSLQQEVQELLEAHELDQSFMKAPAAAQSQKTLLLTVPLAERTGDRIGRYKLMEQIGEGGCGVVYVAEQEEPVRRRVALKVIKLGMDTKQVMARFEAERQALALMDHPNIARVLDAGATETGRPFFVMELVRGIKITDYSDQNKLPTPDRLALFVQVCRAIQHAHQKGVIHRDIKPSNILVTVNDGKPVPKVIDFGIAKATQGRLTDQTIYTAFEQFIGTPAYMSPEQAVMTSLDIDTRTDIYSLGVLLYELLTGRTPFDGTRLIEAGLDAMRQTLRECEPLRPSTRLHRLTQDELTTMAARRGAEAPWLINLLRGDLDWIVMKALEKDRTRRYETANDLALDIERHLKHEPVAARPPAKLYRFQKLVRRNKLAFAAASALAIALLLGAIVSASQAIRATRAEAVAMESQAEAETINRFLTEELLYQATPDVNASEKNITMKEVLEKAARRLDQSATIANQPKVETRLRLAVGNTYFKMGMLSDAERHLRRAVAVGRASWGPRHVHTLAAQETLAWLLVGAMKNGPEGEQLSRETWQIRREVLGPDHRDTLDSMDTYGTALAVQMKLKEAEDVYRECLERRRLGTNNTDVLVSLGNLAQLLAMRGNLQEAEPLLREVIERRTQARLADTTDTFAAINNLANVLLLSGRVDEAERILRDARQRAAQIFGPDNPFSTLRLQRAHARTLAEQGRFEEAEVLASQTLTIHRGIASSQENTARTLLLLGRIKVETGKAQDADPLLREALDLLRQHCPSQRDYIAQAANWLGTVYLARQAYADAENLLLTDVDQFFAPTAQLSPAERRAAIGHVVQLYQRWDKPDRAAFWQSKLDQIRTPQL